MDYGRRARLAALFKAAAVLLAAAAAALFALYLVSACRYADMAERAHGDIASVTAENPHVGAWLTVEGTAIDYPVMRADDDLPEGFYLTHAADGTYDIQGAPYIDARCGTEHLLVYGHHLGYSHLMFSDIADTHGQDRFDSVGQAVYTGADGETTVFHPLMAMSVDKAYEPIQRFSFTEDGALADWLTGLSHDATAKAPDLAARIQAADRALTLVTCTSTRAGQRPRTLLIFTSQA